MSMRPNIYTVFGIDTFNGPYPGEEFYESCFDPITDEMVEQQEDLWYVRDYFLLSEDKNGYVWKPRLVYIEPETCNRHLVGLIKSHDFDSDTFRVLAMLYPEFMQSGHKDVPQEPENMRKMRKRNHPRWPLATGNIEFIESKWFYPQGFYTMVTVWAFVTKYLLDQVGIETDPRNYKWMLVWDWK